MASPASLPSDRISELYSEYLKVDYYPDWFATHLATLEWVAKLSNEELAQPDNQEKLWSAKGITTLGPGEGVNVTGAYSDSAVVRLVTETRTKQWPTLARQRAEELQGHNDRIMSIVREHHSKMRPHARLARLLAALLPAEFHTCFSWDSHKKVTAMLVSSGSPQIVEGAVLCRARLREALGEEPDLPEHVRRSMFCWWLYENRDAVAAGKPVGTGGRERTGGNEGSEAPPLALWPATKQRRGLAAMSGYVETFRAAIQAAQNGASPEDIATSLQGEIDGASEKYGRVLFNRVRRLGFLENRDGLWHPSAEGEELVEADPPDVLVQKLLIQTFGLGHLLRFLREKPLPSKQLYDELRELYPAWTQNFMPSSLAAWARSLGLVELVEDRLALTDYGRFWEDRLPATLPVPPIADEDVDATTNTGESTRPARPSPALAAIKQRFDEDPGLREFVFAEDQLRALHVAWHFHPRKRFVILSGLSGTGKTALLRHYARVYCDLVDLPVDEHLATIAVSPDWRDPTGLLGYFNALHSDPTYQAEPTLRLVLRASRNPGLPYFLILDEMNLARVERYLAPFLSAMETGDRLVLHANDDSVNNVPPSVKWPTNLFIGGTVNMDETTHAFSDKVLDRAFTLEFWDVDLEGLFERRTRSGKPAQEAAQDVLLALNARLAPIRRHFGYRTASEVLDFLAEGAGGAPADVQNDLLDQAVFCKVLPRLRGEDSQGLREALQSVRDLCGERGMPRSIAKLSEMLDRLETTGVTKFWS